VAFYIGTVEAQVQGTLHFHIIVWLCRSLTAQKMQEALMLEAFRIKFWQYIATNIRANLNGADEANMNRMPHECGLSYLWPCNLRESDYEF
jgi:hypothetical protein